MERLLWQGGGEEGRGQEGGKNSLCFRKLSGSGQYGFGKGN